MVARDVMTTGVITVTPETSVPDVARLLLTHRISALPVVDADGHLRGIVSEGDLMRRADTGTARPRSWWLELFGGSAELAQEYVKTHGQQASDVMTGTVVTVEEHTTVADIARLLEERRIKRVPVIRDGRLVGIVSRADLLRGLASRRPLPAASEDDRTLRDRVLRELQSAGVATGANVNVIVEAGVVHLWGIIEDEQQRRACHVAAESVPGVRAVEDHLGWVPPYIRAG